MATPKRRAATYEGRRVEHIERRRRRYYAVMNIPEDARYAFTDEKHPNGRQRLTRTLGTDSLLVAERAAQPFILAWRAQIAKARKEKPYRPKLTDAERAELEAYLALHPPKDVISLAGADYTVIERNGRLLPGSLIEDESRVLGDDETAVLTFQDGSSVKTGGRGPNRASASHSTGNAFGDWIDEWIAGKTFAAKSKDMALSDVRAFAVEFPKLADVTRPAVKRWADALVATSTIKTVGRKLWALRSYWEYLQAIEKATADALPFWDLKLGKQRGSAKKGDKVRAFEVRDLLRILGEANKEDDTELRDLIFCDMWSGARIEEWCSLRIQEIHLTAEHPHYAPGEGKSAAAIRKVPIHDKLLPVIRRMIGKRANGFLFANLSANKYGDRSNGIGKRFGRLKKRLGFQADAECFHSIRHTVAARFTAAKVNPSVIDDIQGWENESMQRHYAGHADLETMAEAVAKLSYAPKKAKRARAARAAD